MQQLSIKLNPLWLFGFFALCVFLLTTATQAWSVIRVCEKCGQSYEEKSDSATGTKKQFYSNNKAPVPEQTAHDGCFPFRSRSAGYTRLSSSACPTCENSACVPTEPPAPVYSAGRSGSGASTLLIPAITSSSQPPGNYQSQALALGVYFLGQHLNNFIYSPQSQIDALHLLWNAASGATRRLLQDFASHPNVQQGAMNTFRRFGYLFFSSRYHLNEHWAESLPGNTDVDVQQLDFNRNSACYQAALNANKRIADSTNGHITQAIDSENWSADTVLALYNICYFAARWQETFRRGTGSFYLMGEDRVDVDILTADSITGGYYQTRDGWRAASLLYQGGDFEMVFILPPEGLLPGAATVGLLSQILSSLETRHDIDFSAPVVSLDSSFDLNDSLRQINLQNLDCTTLDLSSLLTPGPDTGPISLSLIKQKCFLKMDEVGTVAGAVTGMVVADGASYNPVFKANRPYILVLRSVKDKATLFLGAVYNPRILK